MMPIIRSPCPLMDAPVGQIAARLAAPPGVKGLVHVTGCRDMLHRCGDIGINSRLLQSNGTTVRLSGRRGRHLDCLALLVSFEPDSQGWAEKPLSSRVGASRNSFLSLPENRLCANDQSHHHAHPQEPIACNLVECPPRSVGNPAGNRPLESRRRLGHNSAVSIDNLSEGTALAASNRDTVFRCSKGGERAVHRLHHAEGAFRPHAGQGNRIHAR